MGQGEPERAQRLYEEALALARDMEDSFRMAACLESIGALAIDQGETEWAREALSEGLETAQSGGYRKLIAGLLEQFAGLVALEGRPARAAKLYGAAQALREELGAPRPAEEVEHYQAQLDRARSQVGEAEWSAAWDDGQGMELAQAISYAREGVSEPV